MICVFVQLQCRPGSAYDVADRLYQREICSELYSTSGAYDLMAKIYMPEGTDVGHFINNKVLDIDGIVRSLTTMTFKAF
jgi:DNA-binding Lrp family transcriptional regulator